MFVHPRRSCSCIVSSEVQVLLLYKQATTSDLSSLSSSLTHLPSSSLLSPLLSPSSSPTDHHHDALPPPPPLRPRHNLRHLSTGLRQKSPPKIPPKANPQPRQSRARKPGSCPPRLAACQKSPARCTFEPEDCTISAEPRQGRCMFVPYTLGVLLISAC